MRGETEMDYIVSLEQPIVRLGLCMFDVGDMWTGSVGHFHAPSAFDNIDA